MACGANKWEGGGIGTTSPLEMLAIGGGGGGGGGHRLLWEVNKLFIGCESLSQVSK